MSQDQTRRFNSNRYTRIGQLGKGTFGTVYKAIRTDQPGKIYALKVLRESVATAEEIRHFRAEASLMASLSSPYFTLFIEFGQENDYMFIAMEYVEGHSLEEILIRESTLPTQQICRLIRQVGSVLDHLQQRGVVHRDVKPANLMRRPDGNFVLMDVGIACPANPHIQPDQAGTAEYMSPERFGSDAKLTIAADLYSLGCVVYECLTGEIPFRPQPNSNQTVQITTPKSIRSYRSEFPETLDQIILNVLARRPDHRYPSGQAFSDAFAVGCQQIASDKAQHVYTKDSGNEALKWYEYALECQPDNVLFKQEYDNWRRKFETSFGKANSGSATSQGIPTRPKELDLNSSDEYSVFLEPENEDNSAKITSYQKPDNSKRLESLAPLISIGILCLAALLGWLFFSGPFSGAKNKPAIDSTRNKQSIDTSSVPTTEAQKVLRKGNDYMLGRNGESRSPAQAVFYLQKAAQLAVDRLHCKS